MLVEGVMAPVDALMVNPPVEVKVPPVYAPDPDKVTGWGLLTDVQNGVPE